MTVSRRRTLFAAASSVVIGTGITAGAAASLADFATISPEADAVSEAHLIELCARYVEIDQQHEDICGRQEAMRNLFSSAAKVEWERLDGLACEVGDRLVDLEQQVAALQASSSIGLAFKARAVARHMGFYKHGSGAILLRSLLADLVLPASASEQGSITATVQPGAL